MRGRREDMQPSHENCIIPGEADRVADSKSPQGQAAAQLYFDSWTL
jgi:hypothetical protein